MCTLPDSYACSKVTVTANAAFTFWLPSLPVEYQWKLSGKINTLLHALSLYQDCSDHQLYQKDTYTAMFLFHWLSLVKQIRNKAGGGCTWIWRWFHWDPMKKPCNLFQVFVPHTICSYICSCITCLAQSIFSTQILKYQQQRHLINRKNITKQPNVPAACQLTIPIIYIHNDRIV